MASLVIRVIQIKITRYYYVKWKLPITVSVGEEVKQLKLSYIAAGNTKWSSQCWKNSSAISYEIKYIHSIKLRNYLRKRKRNVFKYSQPLNS